MKFRVVGLDRDSGEPCTLVIRAANEKIARQAAQSEGIVVERVELVPLPATQSSSPATVGDEESALLRREFKRLTKAELSVMGTMRSFAGILCVVGVLMMVFGHGNGRSYHPSNSIYGGQRFKTDNAYGATANAAEYMANSIRKLHSPWPIIGSVLFLSGVVALIPAELIRQRAAMRHYGDQLLAQRDGDHTT